MFSETDGETNRDVLAAHQYFSLSQPFTLINYQTFEHLAAAKYH